MAKSLSEAYATYLTWLTPTSTESTSAAAHRNSTKQVLESNFGMTHFFRSGSFGFGTSVTGFSDVDYFAVLPAARLSSDSRVSLQRVRDILANRYPSTSVYVDSPAVALDFGSTDGERHEIIPAFYKSGDAVRVFGIPDRSGGWMLASPEGHERYINEIDRKYDFKLKPLIRILKSWKYHNKVPIRSFYLEVAVAEFVKTQSIVLYEHDVCLALGYISNLRLNPISDPTGLGDQVNCCEFADRQAVASALSSANSLAARARQCVEAGQFESAFLALDKLFGGQFPAYY